MSAPRDFEITFAAAGEREIKARGRLIRVLEAPESHVFITVQGGAELKRRDGQGVSTGADFFERFTVRSEVAQTVRVVVADDPQDDDRNAVSVTASATIEPANTLGAGGDVSIPAASAADLIAADTTRLGVLIVNPVTNTAAVRVGGSGVGATSGVLLEPGESVTLSTSDLVRGYNTHASAAQSLNVLPLRRV